jgi:hypothetical protein
MKHHDEDMERVERSEAEEAGKVVVMCCQRPRGAGDLRPHGQGRELLADRQGAFHGDFDRLLLIQVHARAERATTSTLAN